MNVYIASLPIFNSEMQVAAYILSAQNASYALNIKDDFRVKSEVYFSPELDLIDEVGIEPFAGSVPLLLEINLFHLLTDRLNKTPHNPSSLVFILPYDIVLDNDLLERLESLKNAGFKFAINGFPPENNDFDLLGFVSYIMLDLKSIRFKEDMRDIKKKYPDLFIIIKNVSDTYSFDRLAKDKNMLFTGDFYNQPITKGVSEISPVKFNALKLLKMVNEEDFDLENIADIIERDLALSISLLRFINTGITGKRSKIDSINKAVAFLGQKTVRQWAMIAISVSLADDRPNEITKLSLMRAKFAENLAIIFDLAVFQNSLFMAGLFSLLDVILEKPMEEAINEISVDKIVHEALVQKSGRLYEVLEFMSAYERADWNKVSITIIRNGIDTEEVNQAFIDSLVWYHQLLEAIDSNNADKENEDTNTESNEEIKTDS